ncbi:hypothetical protein SAMN04488500_13134 [Sporomusa malonica]|uniref:Glycosyl transferase family 2 n=1 Tax=Sporomusa malonica TaxID=112901 RepID=A0A1W2EV80_9FIRM|nr:hypothetical protein SAMN04488500_13134 [Sporomusa malonica]
MSEFGRESHSPITISLCMIVKNEEATIERCLRSVQPPNFGVLSQYLEIA